MKSPRRELGGPPDAWRLVLLGECVRVLDRPVRVRPESVQRLPNSGHWERGLAQLRPAMDDVLGATAFAVAWRWGCASIGRNAWPGAALVCEKATDRLVTVEPGLPAFAQSGEFRLFPDVGDRSWILEGVATFGVSGPVARVDWSEVDRVADIVSAWLDVPWSVATREPARS